MTKDKIIKELIAFVEGKMDFDTFWKKYKTNDDYYKTLDDKMPGEKYRRLWKQTINQNINIFDPNTHYGKTQICNSVYLFLKYYGFSVSETDIYIDKLKFIFSVQPSYVHIEDEDFLNKIIEQAPKELKKGEKKKWIKDRIKELFKYDVKPPRWIQFPEWPIVNGKPLVFKKQTKERKDDERVFYTFYDPDTLEEVVIMQSY